MTGDPTTLGDRTGVAIQRVRIKYLKYDTKINSNMGVGQMLQVDVSAVIRSSGVLLLPLRLVLG